MARPKDDTLRARLMAAATTVFAEQGFRAANLEVIGRRAGVTKGGVYFHFRSKEALFFAVLDHWQGALRDALATAPAGASAAEALRNHVRTWLAFHFEHPDAGHVLRVLAAELRSGFTTELRADRGVAQRAQRARIRDLFAQGAQDGSLFTGDPALAAFALAAALEGIVHQWLASPRDAAPFCHAGALAEALVAPYATGVVHRAAVEGGREFVPPF